MHGLAKIPARDRFLFPRLQCRLSIGVTVTALSLNCKLLLAIWNPCSLAPDPSARPDPWRDVPSPSDIVTLRPTAAVVYQRCLYVAQHSCVNTGQRVAQNDAAEMSERYVGDLDSPIQYHYSQTY